MRDIILIHGALETSDCMRPLGELLNESFKVHYLNLSGHDQKSAMPEPFRIETFVIELDEYIKKHKILNPTVMGHSMGGYIALSHKAFVEDSPIQRIITYGTKFNWSETTVSQMLVQLHPENEALVEHLKKVFGDNGLRLLASTQHLMNHLERLDGLTPLDLEEIDIPIDLILGDKDKVVSIEETQNIKNCLSQAQLHILNDSRHEMERCNLNALAAIILGQ
ncbi:MAG: alpha/beta hydrolase [Bacteriovoracaceae bacterium]|nr:alpha/beta hydrolase [Bacteriovoracaceae bacterium]